MSNKILVKRKMHMLNNDYAFNALAAEIPIEPLRRPKAVNGKKIRFNRKRITGNGSESARSLAGVAR